MISIALAIWCGDFAFFASFHLNYYSGVLGTPGIPQERREAIIGSKLSDLYLQTSPMNLFYR